MTRTIFLDIVDQMVDCNWQAVISKSYGWFYAILGPHSRFRQMGLQCGSVVFATKNRDFPLIFTLVHENFATF